MPRRILFFVLLSVCLVLAARVGERLGWQLDLSAQKLHSLSPAAASALDTLGEALHVTVYIGDRPVQRAEIERLLAPYLAHPGRAQVRFVDPVADPAAARAAGVTGDIELHLAAGERQEVLRRIEGGALDAALHRLARRGDRWIVALAGHGEARVDDSPGGLSTLARRLEALGYRMLSVEAGHLERLPENTAVLLLAAPERVYGPGARRLIEDYMAGGGALLALVGESGAPALAGLGIETLPGIVVDAAAADQAAQGPDHAVVDRYPPALLARAPDGPALLRQARALRLTPESDWRSPAGLSSSPRSWNETGSLRGEIRRDPALGEQAGPLTVGLALERGDSEPPQRAVVIGSAHFLSNAELGRADNLALAVGLFNWLSANETVIAPQAGPDQRLRWSALTAGLAGVTFMAVLPALFLITGLVLRSRRRRA
jgi:hypothetical protein